MPLPRFQRLADEKRSRLLEIAAKEFAAKGFDAASLNEILAKADLGKSSYYYYFEDKDDLYATCVLDSFLRLGKEAPPFDIDALQANNFWSSLEHYFQSLVDLGVRHPVQIALFREVPALRARLASRFQAMVAQMTAPAVHVIRKGQSLGCIRTDMPPERLFHVGIAADNALDDDFFTATPDPGTDAIRAHGALVLDTWRRLLLPAPTPQRRRR